MARISPRDQEDADNLIGADRLKRTKGHMDNTVENVRSLFKRANEELGLDLPTNFGKGGIRKGRPKGRRR